MNPRIVSILLVVLVCLYVYGVVNGIPAAIYGALTANCFGLLLIAYWLWLEDEE